MSEFYKKYKSIIEEIKDYYNFIPLDNTEYNKILEKVYLQSKNKLSSEIKTDIDKLVIEYLKTNFYIIDIFDKFINSKIKYNNNSKNNLLNLKILCEFINNFNVDDIEIIFFELIESNSTLEKILINITNSGIVNNIDNKDILLLIKTYYEFNNKDVKRKDKELPKLSLAKEEVRELLMKAKQGDKKALDKIIRDNINLVRFVANKYVKFGLEYDDLVQEGIIGLIKAINKCDLKRSTSFSTYAVYWIRQSINTALAYQGRTISLSFDAYERLLKIENIIINYKNKFGIEPTLDEVAAKTGLDIEIIKKYYSEIPSVKASLDNPISQDENNNATFLEFIPDNSINIENDVIRKFQIQQFKVILNKVPLKPMERTVIEYYFGLNGNNPKNLAEIGRMFNLSREYMRVTLKNTLRKLKHSDLMMRFGMENNMIDKLSLKQLEESNLKELYNIFENNIKSIINDYKFINIPQLDLNTIINNSLLEVQSKAISDDKTYLYQLFNRILKDNLINYLKVKYANNKSTYVIKLIESKVKNIKIASTALNNILLIIRYLKEIDFLEDKEVLKILTHNNAITNLLDIIIASGYKEIDNFEEQDILIDLIIMYKPEISKADIRKSWHNLFSILFEYEPSVVIDTIKKLPVEYQSILERRFGPNYNALIKDRYWSKKDNYVLKYVIIPLIKNIINNNIENKEVDLFTIFSNYSFNLILDIINSLDINYQRILQGRFGINYNELIDDDKFLRRYKKACYKEIIPFIYKKAKLLTKENVNINNRDLLTIFSNYDSSLVISAIDDLTEYEISYLQSIYGGNYNQVLINISLNNNEYLNLIFSRIRNIIKDKLNLTEQEKNTLDLLSLLSNYDQNKLLMVIDSLPDSDKEILKRKYGENYNEVNHYISRQDRRDITSRIIPKIRRRLENYEKNGRFKVVNVEEIPSKNNNQESLISISEVLNSIEFKELTSYLTKEEAIIIMFQYLGYNGRYLNIEKIAKLLNVSILEVRNIANQAINKYNEHNNGVTKKLVPKK